MKNKNTNRWSNFSKATQLINDWCRIWTEITWLPSHCSYHYDQTHYQHRTPFSLGTNDKMLQAYCVVSYLLKTISIYYRKLSMSQEFRSSWAEWFWLRFPWKVAIKMLVRLQSPEGLTGPANSPSNMAHSHSCCQEASGPYQLHFCI